MKKQNAGNDPVVVKKYANRRLYNTDTSSYITLDHLAAMTRAGRDFTVLDARSDEDITHTVLTQIIMEEEGRGETMLPVNFLRRLIAMYGDSMQAMVPRYLEASMDSLHRNREHVTAAVDGPSLQTFATMPAAELARCGTSAASPDAEIADLKAELATLTAKVDRMAMRKPA